MKILLTGAGGFIGSNLARKLLSTEFNPTISNDVLPSRTSEGLRKQLAEQELST